MCLQGLESFLEYSSGLAEAKASMGHVLLPLMEVKGVYCVDASTGAVPTIQGSFSAELSWSKCQVSAS